MTLKSEDERRLCYETEDVARTCLTMYLQSWGQSVEARVNALNGAVKCAGLDALFIQSADGATAWWSGPDAESALEMRRLLDTTVSSGDATEECRRIERIIEQFRKRVEEER